MGKKIIKKVLPLLWLAILYFLVYIFARPLLVFMGKVIPSNALQFNEIAPIIATFLVFVILSPIGYLMIWGSKKVAEFVKSL